MEKAASGVAFTIEIDQMVDGNLQWRNPTQDPRQLERILIQALAHVQRELLAVATANVVHAMMAQPRIATPGPGSLPPPGWIRP